MEIMDRLISLLYPPPPACVACGAPVRRHFCAACETAMVYGAAAPCCGLCGRKHAGRRLLCVACLPGAPPYRAVAAVGPYEGALREAVHLFKFGGRTCLARPLSDLMLSAAGALQRPCVVVPVPLHRRRLAQRGYNQAALLAERVARGLKVPCCPRALVRRRATAAQTGLGRGERQRNLEGAFAARPRLCRDKHVLLVDDVLTTGATARAAAAALLAAGAAAVDLLVLAVAETQAGFSAQT